MRMDDLPLKVDDIKSTIEGFRNFNAECTALATLAIAQFDYAMYMISCINETKEIVKQRIQAWELRSELLANRLKKYKK